VEALLVDSLVYFYAWTLSPKKVVTKKPRASGVACC